MSYLERRGVDSVSGIIRRRAVSNSTNGAGQHEVRAAAHRPSPITTAGTVAIRIGLSLVLILVGGLKFTPGTAHEIQLYIVHSPIFSWLDLLFSERQLSAVFGTFEISAGILIALRSFAPSFSALGSLIACALFLSTMSFMFTTPGVLDPHLNFPEFSDLGAFLVKDVTLFGAALYTLGEALQHAGLVKRVLDREAAM